MCCRHTRPSTLILQIPACIVLFTNCGCCPGFLLIFSITSKPSFEDCKALRLRILRVKGEDRVPMVLVRAPAAACPNGGKCARCRAPLTQNTPGATLWHESAQGLESLHAHVRRCSLMPVFFCACVCVRVCLRVCVRACLRVCACLRRGCVFRLGTSTISRSTERCRQQRGRSWPCRSGYAAHSKNSFFSA